MATFTQWVLIREQNVEKPKNSIKVSKKKKKSGKKIKKIRKFEKKLNIQKRKKAKNGKKIYKKSFKKNL
jgi:hypothetical protein